MRLAVHSGEHVAGLRSSAARGMFSTQAPPPSDIHLGLQIGAKTSCPQHGRAPAMSHFISTMRPAA